MMDIVKELIAAERELLQRDWDKWLLRWWKDKPNAYMTTCQEMFIKQAKINIEKFDTLKRVPRYIQHRKTRVLRFVAAYLPTLNTALLGGKIPEEELAGKLYATKMDTLVKEVDERKRKKDGNEIHYAKRKFAAANKAKALGAALFEQKRESNWNVCK